MQRQGNEPCSVWSCTSERSHLIALSLRANSDAASGGADLQANQWHPTGVFRKFWYEMINKERKDTNSKIEKYKINIYAEEKMLEKLQGLVFFEEVE